MTCSASLLSVVLFFVFFFTSILVNAGVVLFVSVFVLAQRLLEAFCADAGVQ